MILVTGATGMIGRAVVIRLMAEGLKVRAHARSTMGLEHLFPTPIKPIPEIGRIDLPDRELERAVADISNLTAEEARKMCDGCSTVVHTAGLVHLPAADEKLYESTNVRATKLLAEAATACGARQFIFLSSSSVYGNCSTRMVDEGSALHGDTPYAASKIASEDYLSAHPPAESTVILRPSLVFGEGDRGNMRSLIRQVSSGRYFIIGDGSAQKSLIYSGDLAAAILQIVKKTPASSSAVELFNLANPEPVSVKHLSEAILEACGKKTDLLSLPAGLINMAASAANALLGKRSPLSADRLAKLTRDNSISVNKFVKQYDFEPEHAVKDGLANEFAWMKQQAAQIHSD